MEAATEQRPDDDYEAASEKLSQATELSVDLYGQFAPQGYQPHYYYGRAMTEIARAESMVVKPHNNANGEFATEHGTDIAPEAPVTEKAEKQLEASETVQQNADQTLKTEDGEDVDELTAANWPGSLLKQEQTTEWMEKKADVLIALGECILVDENFGNALEEFKAALEIQKRSLSLTTARSRNSFSDGAYLQKQ
uniref:Tetratricopeptide SHNi-TPR domain-containing protein n=1 Tax=Ditylenchus dipsaci TaxID=166011 RepID=A0A915D001_9BILA